MRIQHKFSIGAFVVAGAILVACGGGGGGTTPPTGGGGGAPSTAPSTGGVTGGSPTAAASPSPSASASASAGTLSGTVVSIPQGTYGSGAPQTAYAGVTVVVGSVPVLGATPPASAPAGDVIGTTNASGTFSVTPAHAPAAPTSAAPFVYPVANVFNVTTPATGYYVSVFAPGSDGMTANEPIPYHGFLAVTAGSVGTVRVTTASPTESAFLTDVNTFRTSVGVQTLIFDELTEEAARLHATDEATVPVYYCHYDRTNQGPSTRFLELGGLGSDAENIDAFGGDSPTAYIQADQAFEAEGPGGDHYNNLVDPTHQWAGLAQIFSSANGGAVYIDQELNSPTSAIQDTYSIFSGSECPAGTVANNS